MGIKNSQIRDYNILLSRINGLKRCSGLEAKAREIRERFFSDFGEIDFNSPVQWKQTCIYYRNLVDKAFRDWYERNRLTRF